MPKEDPKFDTASVRASWDHVADAWAHGLVSGLDFYRLDFFGPAHVAACGDVGGARVLRAVHTVLRPGARFVASITHPCTDTPFREWQREPDGRKRCLCIDRYFDRTTLTFTWQRWQFEFTTSALHAPLEDWFDWIHGAGFALRAFREPRPSEQALRERPELEDASKVPYYVIFDLVRGAA